MIHATLTLDHSVHLKRMKLVQKEHVGILMTLQKLAPGKLNKHSMNTNKSRLDTSFTALSTHAARACDFADILHNGTLWTMQIP